MEWKYKFIFLSVLLCLLGLENSVAQRCISIEYDENGNRVHRLIGACGFEDVITRNADLIDAVNNINVNDDKVMIYPNPTDGIITVEVKMELDTNPVILELLNSHGVVLCKHKMSNKMTIDIADKPSGVYLLRITTDVVCNKMVIKL